MNGERAKKMVLVVEDSKLLRSVLLDALKQAGFGTYDVDNGRNGLTSALAVHPDIIVLDVLMPVMDGLTMYQELRKDTWGSHVPVILLTGEDEERVRGVLHDNIDFIKKDDKMVETVISRIKSRLGIQQN